MKNQHYLFLLFVLLLSCNTQQQSEQEKKIQELEEKIDQLSSEKEFSPDTNQEHTASAEPKNKDENLINIKTIRSEGKPDVITFESSNSICYITDVYEKNGQTLITVDYILIKIEDDGRGTSRKTINDNPKLRTFIINSTTKFIQPRLSEALRGNLPRELSKLSTHENGELSEFVVTVVNGLVTELGYFDAG